MYVQMCICFFFKQKTAYEMRISDWSSDVCSSDLRKGSTNSARGAARLIADSLATVKRCATGLVLARADSAFYNADVVAAIGRGGEIGRASCRERVCQYV